MRRRSQLFSTTAAIAMMAAVTAGPHLAVAQSEAPASGDQPMQAKPMDQSGQPNQQMQDMNQRMREGMKGQMQQMQGQQPTGDEQAQAGDQQAPRANEQMQAVLDELKELGAKPIASLSVEEARNQPTPADAVAAVMDDKGIEPDPALQQVQTEDIMIPGAGGEIAARIYRPSEGQGPFPVIVYYHGGGWVIADIDTYDASARALAANTNAIVVSSHYRQAPEHPFPAAHEDAYAAYEWVAENAPNFDGDPQRIAVVGESAGGNLAANVAIMAVEKQARKPLHQVLVYPIAGHDFDTQSYRQNANAAPLDRAAMEWFFENALENPDQAEDPRIALVDREDLQDLPPATVITAEIDPLRSEGQTYADNLKAAGVKVDSRNFEGVTHEFFGMGAVVDEAREAVEFASANLREAFGETAGAVTGTSNGKQPDQTQRQTPQRSDTEGGGQSTEPQPVQ